MGRPLHKKYFGNTNYKLDGEGVGGERLSAVALGTAGSGYSQGLTATVSDPQIEGGETATITVAVNPATGAITGYTVVNGGSGYTSAPTVTLVLPGDAVTDATFTTGSADIEVVDATGIYIGMRATSTNISSNQTVTDIDGTTITLSAVPDGAGTDEEVTFSDEGASGVAGARTLTSAARVNAIAAYAYVSGNSLLADIIKQESSRRYKVATSEGIEVCKLVTDGAADDVGEMTIIATDSDTGTYYVKKLTARKAVLIPIDGTQFTSGASVKWTFGSAVEDESVTIANN